MGNKSSVQMVIKTHKNFYFPGETIDFSLFIDSPKPQPCSKIVLQVQGYEECEFKFPNNNQPQFGKNNIIQTCCVLKEFWSNKTNLHGQYQYPCTFTLPYYLPGSFKQEKGNYKAKIYYCIKAFIIPPTSDSKFVVKEQEIIIRQPQKQFDQHQYGETLLYPKCWGRNLGVCKVNCYFQKKNYLPNEHCTVICEVDNFKSRRDITSIKCEFVKTVTLRSFNGSQRTFTQTISTIEFKPVKRGQGYIGQNAERRIIPLKDKNTSTSIHASTCGNMVRCQYMINVTPTIGGCFTKGSQTFSVKLQILHPELVQFIEKPEQWAPEVENVSQIFLNYKNDEEMRQSLK